jgi:hypothetical protein
MTFSPYVLFRRGTLDIAELSGMVPERTWALLDQAAVAADHRAAVGERLCGELHRLVPTVPAAHRGILLRARRAVHNDRTPQLPAPVVQLLPAECRELLSMWIRHRESADVLAGQATATFAVELDIARKTLADVALHEDFRRGLQLCGEGIHREVSSYATDPFDRSRKASRRRRAESTITSYAYRVVFKPSPFGSFTEIGAQPFGAPESGPRSQRVAQARVSIGLLAWMVHQLHGLERAEEILRVRLNNSLVVRGDRAVFVRRPMEGADDTLVEDQVISARRTGLVDFLATALGEHDLSERELREALTERGLPADDAAHTIDQLVQLGLCHRGLGLPDQTIGIAGHAAAALRALDTAQARECMAIFQRTQAIEDEYAVAHTQRRAELLTELRALVSRLAAVCGRPAPPVGALEAIVYEDLGNRGTARNWQPELLRRNAANFALFQRLVAVLDDATIERLGLYRFYRKRFGDGQSGLLDCYAAFAALSPAEAGAVMSGVDDPESARVRGLQEELCAMLHGQLTGAADGVVELDAAALREFADALPDFLAPWRSAAYRVQLTEGQERALAVVNGVTTGNGVFFSRFCDLLEPETPGQWNLREQLRAHIAATTPWQTDITATLGLNFNLHPRLTPLELVYPGSVARPSAEQALNLADVVVRPDPVARRLTLVSTVDCQPLDLVPMNFLFPTAAPMLYRFLCAFAPTRTYRGGLWEQLDRHGDWLATVTERPRALLGDLVLDRRSWQLPVAELPPLEGLERQELDAMAAFDRWRVERGLPRQLFFRLIAPRGEAADVRDLLAETKRWALEARSARMHKPHFLDMRNPFLLYVFAKQANAMPEGVVQFSECLPATSRGSAEELFVEFMTEAGNG